MEHMKTIYFLILLFSFSAYSKETPIFYMQFRSSIFTPPQYSYKKECEIDETQAIITYTDISGTKVTKKPVAIDPNWDNLIAGAMNGELEEQIGPPDFGFQVFMAFRNNFRVILSGLDEDGNAVTNSAPETEILKEIIRGFCE
jgi:hypothetical protein